jgi:hypothetical protein
MTDESQVPELAHFRARLDRAEELYEALGTAWGVYLEQRPHRLVTKLHGDGRGELLMERVVPMPPELGLILGEFLYQLRAALDNCLYAVAVIVAGTSPPPGAGALQWPICDTAEAFNKQRSRLKYLRADLVDALEAIQPYQAELPTWNSLWLLNDLARVDRHRTLHLVTLVPVDSELIVDFDVIENVELRAGEDLHDRGIILTFVFKGSGGLRREHIDGNFEFEVELADVERSVGPTGEVMRPWGTLAKRLQSMRRAVLEYAEGLVYLACNPDVTEPPHANGP